MVYNFTPEELKKGICKSCNKESELIVKKDGNCVYCSTTNKVADQLLENLFN